MELYPYLPALNMTVELPGFDSNIAATGRNMPGVQLISSAWDPAVNKSIVFPMVTTCCSYYQNGSAFIIATTALWPNFNRNVTVDLSGSTYNPQTSLRYTSNQITPSSWYRGNNMTPIAIAPAVGDGIAPPTKLYAAYIYLSILFNGTK
jgi:hypothetical protein